MALTSEIIYGFASSVLAERFDDPKPTPDFHKELWEYCTLEHPYVAIAAPRGHAKSTAVTHAYVLASVLFRENDFVMIVSDTEGQAVQFLYDIKIELQENETLRELFGIDKFLRDTATDIVVRTKDRSQFKIIAKGSEQKVRGTKWLGKRPNLIVGDDLENEELTSNPDRRKKFKEWFYGALLPAGSDSCKFRIVGTILHLDSMLENLLNDSTWVSHRYQAHQDDFTEILWPEKFPKERLSFIRQSYINQGFPEGYYQEYLNLPIDPANAFFRQSDLIPMREEHFDEPMYYYGSVDFAISERERADRTVITVGGVSSSGHLNIIYVAVGRWDAKQIVDEMLSAQQRFDLEIMTVESGMIEKAIGPYLNEAMLKTGVFINLNKETPTKDKQMRARSIQGRMRAGGVRFDTDAEWYTEVADELLVFPKGKHDDIVDSLAWLGLTVDKFVETPTEEEIMEDIWEDEYEETYEPVGMNWITGY